MKSFICLALSMISCSQALCQRVITTVAGTDWIFSANGKAVDTPLSSEISRLAVDSQGNLFVADPLNYVVLKIDRRNVVTVVAGNGIPGFSGDGGPATSASLVYPYAIALDGSGNIFVGDSFNYRIRKISPDGIITTIAGTGRNGFSGDGGPATQASFTFIEDLRFDASGKLYVADAVNNRVRRISSDGMVTTFAGNGQAGFSGDGGPATNASLSYPSAVAFDSRGNAYIADFFNYRVRIVTPDGKISTFAGNGTKGFSGDGGAATSASLNTPYGLALDAADNLFISDVNNSRTRMVTPQGVISTVAGDGEQQFSGDGGPALKASFFFPRGLAFDPAGKLLVVDRGNSRVRSITIEGSVSTVAGNGSFRNTPDGTQATDAFLFHPSGVAVDSAGNLYISDTLNNTVRKISPSGEVLRIAGTGVDSFGPDDRPAIASGVSVPNGIALAPNGDVVIADRGNDRVRRVGADGIIKTIAGNETSAFGGDGGPATQAGLNLPSTVAFDKAGNLYIADEGNHRVRKVTPDGIISTLAGDGQARFAGDGGPATGASLDTPTGVAVDSAGNVYIGEFNNYRIRKVALNGTITTFAGNGRYGSTGDGGQAVDASLGNVYALAFDSAGNLYFSERFHHSVRRIAPGGVITTVAGNGRAGFSGDGGPAPSASLNGPNGLAVDASGNLYIADVENNRIRAVLVTSPTYNISTSRLSFTVKSGGAISPEQTIDLAASLQGASFTGTRFNIETSAASAQWLQVSPAAGTIPATLRVSVNPANLRTGTYETTITITAPGASPPVRTVTVRVVVTDPAPPTLGLDVENLSFSFVQGASISTKQFTVNNRGGGSLAFTAAASTASGGAWLSVSPTAGTATPASPVSLTVAVNPSSLPAGTYTGAIRITTNSGAPVSVPVNITVSKSQAIILLSQTGLTFTAVAQGGAVLPQTFGILNVGQGVLDWSAKSSTLSGGNWLKISATGGSVAQAYLDVSSLEVGIDPAGLAAGNYFGQTQITAPGVDNSPQTVSVILNVLPAGSTPEPEVRPTGLVFIGVAGASPGSQTVMISNITSRPVNFNSAGLTLDGQNWFTYAPKKSAVTPDQATTLVVQPDFTELEAGTRRGVLAIIFEGLLRSVNILSVVAPGAGKSASAARFAGGSCTPSKLLPQVTSPGDKFVVPTLQPVRMEARVVDDCGSPVVDPSASVTALFDSGDREIKLVHTKDGFWSNTWQPRGANEAKVRIVVRALSVQGTQRLGGDSESVAGTLRSGAPTPLVAPGAVLNGASFVAQRPVAPGSLISIFGSKLADGTAVADSTPLKTELSGTEVVLGGRSLPLLYASDGQVNAQVPYELPINTTQQLLVRRGVALSVPEEVTVAASQPAIFTKDQSGSGQGVVVNGATNALAEPGRPVQAGDTVVIFCAGLGAVDPEIASGAAAIGLSRTVNPVTVMIGDKQATVTFSGLTPGFPGLYQVNAVVPVGVTPGDAVSVVISVAGQTSPPVTMAVE